jgi:hypothetical protein
MVHSVCATTPIEGYLGTYTPNDTLHKTDEAQEAEAITTLTAIHAFRLQNLPKQASAECHYILAQLYYACNKVDLAKDFATQALEGGI